MKYKVQVFATLSFIFLVSFTLKAQQVSSQDSATIEKDEIIGGNSIGRQIELDKKSYTFQYRFSLRPMNDWYALKDSLLTKRGIQFGIDYTSVYMRSSKVISDVNNQNTASGILNIQLGWNLINRKKGKNKGTLFIKFSDRHAYSGLTSPMFHGLEESGYYGLTATGYSDYSMRILEFNYQQFFANQRLGFVAGKIDLANYFNFHGISNPSMHFMGYGAMVTGTGNWGNPGLGAIVMGRPTEQLYAMLGANDVYGDLFESGDFFDLGRNWENGDFMYMGEIGYVPSYDERFFKRVSLMAWKSPNYTSYGGNEIAAAEGIAFSSHWFIAQRYAPYIKFGFSDGGGENTFYKRDVQLGHGLRFRHYDMLGTSFSWAETNIPDTKDQMTIELFYRYNVTAHIEVTADYQYIINPTLNPSENGLSYIGFRGRIKL
ncbi:carbohydrate porin [Carboxylicivirga sp. M1479]|uniref:carbohydrate porin n=1 Tax=Carboxylicivirga sp. M1479 TaxID=2594476 RepID=UPI001177774E|nr:carbohydrate porin [Carboxylicivirga sp. M1479]TRX63316.1 carbohydrate porin [Carboxylicivirga sp. M1479]